MSSLPRTHGAAPTAKRIVSQSGSVHAVGASGYRTIGQGRIQTVCDMHFEANPTPDDTPVTCPFCIATLERAERESVAAEAQRVAKTDK